MSKDIEYTYENLLRKYYTAYIYVTLYTHVHTCEVMSFMQGLFNHLLVHCSGSGLHVWAVVVSPSPFLVL